jgi:hypothetical protein
MIGNSLRHLELSYNQNFVVFFKFQISPYMIFVGSCDIPYKDV